MATESILNILKKFREAIERRGVRVVNLVLYGSQAQGTARKDSDIDVVVVSPAFVGMDYWQRIEVLSQAICEVWEPIEAVAMTPQEWKDGDSMIAQFARQGEMVYSE